MEKRNKKSDKIKKNKKYPYKKLARRLTPIYVEGVDCPKLTKLQALNQIRKDLPTLQEKSPQNRPKSLKTTNLNEDDDQNA